MWIRETHFRDGSSLSESELSNNASISVEENQLDGLKKQRVCEKQHRIVSVANGIVRTLRCVCVQQLCEGGVLVNLRPPLCLKITCHQPMLQDNDSSNSLRSRVVRLLLFTENSSFINLCFKDNE